MFSKKSSPLINQRLSEFNYLNGQDIYLDNACQTLRPQPVIDAQNNYYLKFNACGDRCKHKWGQEVDSLVYETRLSVLDLLKLSPKNYVCSFTLNTTYGLNLILTQLPQNTYKQVITSEIEHNSVFLPTIELAKRLSIPRLVLARDNSGELQYSNTDLKQAIVVVNVVSNIDGRILMNLKQLIKDTHQQGGIVILDAAQTIVHHHDLIVKTEADAICFSGHKMYSPSLGVIIIKKDLLKNLTINFVGGGMISSVTEQSYKLLPNEMHTWLEPGLQAYGAIIGLNTAIGWLQKVKPFGQEPKDYIDNLAQKLYNGLKDINNIEVFNNQPSSVISFYPKKGDAHRLAIFLSSAGIMARSGSFCCHYYIDEVLKSPPLLRVSLGLHNTEADINKAIETIAKLTKA